MKKVIFFDRDDTLIKDVPYLNDPSKITLFPDTIDTLQKLKKSGYEFIIVTNQSGIARGLITDKELAAVHSKLQQIFADHDIHFLKIYHSPHMPDSNHPTRKPNPGMILEACNDFEIDKARSYMVGDKISDGQAGLNAGLKTFLLNESLSGCTSIKTLSELLEHIIQ